MDRYLIVLGKDITVPEIQGYRDGGCEEGEEIEGVTADVVRFETTLGEIVWKLLIEERELSYFEEAQIDIAFDEMLFGSMAELMYDYGILSDDVAEKYEWGSLEDMWTETYNMQRVMYVNFDVVIPANGSVRVDADMRKDASFDLENGITQVELDVNEPHYYMEVRKVSSEGEENISTG